MVAGHVAANDTIADPSAAQDIADGSFDAPVLVVPGVPVVANPSHRRGIKRRETFGMTPRLIERADQRNEFGILREAVLVFTASEVIHVLSSGHPAGISAIERHGKFSNTARKERVAAIELPSVHAPVEHLLLEEAQF